MRDSRIGGTLTDATVTVTVVREGSGETEQTALTLALVFVLLLSREGKHDPLAHFFRHFSDRAPTHIVDSHFRVS